MSTAAVLSQIARRRHSPHAGQLIVYIVSYAARGFYMPFISLYLLSVGFMPSEVGLLTGVSAAVRLVVVPAISAGVDRLGAHRRLLAGEIALTALTSFGLVALPSRLWLGSMVVTRDCTDVPSAALMAQLSITSFRERGGSIYGKLRAMGSLGWGLASVISGALVALGGYALLMVLAGVLNLVMLPFIRAFPERTAATNSRIDKPPKHRPAFWLVMASNLLFYIGLNPFFVFLFVYCKDYLGADDAMVGLVAACLGLFEIPWMIGMGRIYKHMTTRWALMLGIVGQAVFALCLTLITGTGLVLFLLIAARGLFYALHNISLTLIVNEISHPANAATNQAISWVTIPALAAIITGPIAGWVYENADARLLFVGSAFAMLIGALLLVIGRGIIEQAREARLPALVN